MNVFTVIIGEVNFKYYYVLLYIEVNKMETKIEWICKNCKKVLEERKDEVIVDVNGFVYCSDQCICDDYSIENPGPARLVEVLSIKMSGTYYHSMDEEIQELVDEVAQ